MNKKIYDIDIEFGHVYTDNPDINQSQKSIELIQNILKNKTLSIKTSLLIDDYNKKSILNIPEYLNAIKHKITPDNIMLESYLCNFTEQILQSYFTNTTQAYYKKENKTVVFYNTELYKIPLKQIYHSTGDIKYTCPLLTLIWYLIRLGLIKINSYVTNVKKIINILDKKFQENEQKVLALLKQTSYKKHINDIEYIFY